jgi:hypothetical protein
LLRLKPTLEFAVPMPSLIGCICEET